ncbi:DUF726-domain-containing protein [Zymoseptoria brevis]|uniref:DUF726-domain-containing protein n=1 Tax=Zymoseptoria brevis TaxID=1047168 RepID=A0A0F4GRT9_9PEZI|nr:DUF726-domain-containing protein [Zymoseptoria brevis]
MFSKVPGLSSFSKEQHEQPAEEEGESLTTVLETPGQRGDLTLLIADCTEAMRQGILDVFDANETGATATLISESDDLLVSTEPTKAEAADKEKLSRELAQREKELSASHMQELKEAALKHFDEWRSNVIQRVGEVVNSREEAQEQKANATSKKEPSEPAGSPPIKFRLGFNYDEGVRKAMEALYPPMPNLLSQLPEAQRALILHSVLLLLLSLEHYRAESRVLLLRLTTSLGLSPDFLGENESKVARVLLTAAENMNADDETKKKAEENQGSRKWKVGIATVAGAALIGVTGGLAAPLLAAGVGSVMGGLGLGTTVAAGYLGTLAGSGVLVGGLFGAYGGRMTGKMMDEYAREVEDFAFQPVRTYHKPRKIEKESRRLRVAIGISGWLTDADEVVQPWKVIGPQLEAFALRWELKALLNLGNSLTTMIKSAAWGAAKKEIIKRTVFGALMAGLWPLGLLKVSRVLDNPFGVANSRAHKAGQVLADAIINKAQGERPLTLVGYSLGAKVIFSCLQTLAERKAFGLVESVVLIGTPASTTAAEWRLARSVVSGRLVNVFSTNDYILGFLYRTHSIQYGVAGLQAIQNVKGIENVDVSDFVSGHTQYRFLTGRILNQIGFEDVDVEAMAEEEKALREQEAKDEKERTDNELAEGAQSLSTDDEGTTPADDKYVQGLEKEIAKKNENSYLAWTKQSMAAAGSSASSAFDSARNMIGFGRGAPIQQGDQQTPAPQSAFGEKSPEKLA